MFCCASKEASLYRAGRWTGHVSGYVLLCTPLATLPAISGSYSGLLPWSAGLCWLLLRSTCEIFACYPTSGTRGRSSRNSTERGGVVCVHVARNSTRQTLALSVVGPSVWNRLQLALRLFPMILSDTFYSSLKTALLAIQG